MKYELTIGWLYPELMSTYGDRGNIICLKRRCEWREIDVKIKTLDLGFKTDDLIKCNLLFMGGAQDKEQQIVSKDLSMKRNALKEMIDDGITGLYICGAYQFLGKYYKEANGTIIDGLNILDLYTENPGENNKRLIGNIVVKLQGSIVLSFRGAEATRNPNEISHLVGNDNSALVGFENHGGRTYLGKNVMPLGKVIKGFGNNGEDKTEGAIYKNSFGSYLHGPILPKNPHFADHLIKLSLERKYKKSIAFSHLDDSLEWQAHNAIAKRIGIAI